MSIDGPSPADITKREDTPGVQTVCYVPVMPGEYEISVKVKGQHIHGSPFSAKISGENLLNIATVSNV